MVYRTAKFSSTNYKMTLNDPLLSIQGHANLWRWIPHKRLKIWPWLTWLKASATKTMSPRSGSPCCGRYFSISLCDSVVCKNCWIAKLSSSQSSVMLSSHLFLGLPLKCGHSCYKMRLGYHTVPKFSNCRPLPLRMILSDSAKYSMTGSNARSLRNSWASC